MLTDLLWRYALMSLTMGLLAACVLLLLPRLSKRATPRSLHAMLLLLVLGFLIPWRPPVKPLYTVPVPQVRLSQPQVITGTPIAPDPFIEVPSTPAEMPTMEQTITAPAFSEIAPIALGGLWLLGILGFLAHQLRRHHRFMRTVRRWSTPAQPATAALLAETCQSLGIRRTIRLAICPCIGTPMLTGLLRPTILLSDEALPPETLRLILRHELVHYRRGDLVSKGLMLLAGALHWYNPIMPFLSRALNMQCELSVDAAVIRSLPAAAVTHYGETIIRAAQACPPPRTALATTFHGGTKEMKKRILSLLDRRTKRMGAIVLLLVLVLSLTIGGAVATETFMDLPEPSAADPAAAPGTINHAAANDEDPTSSMQENALTEDGQAALSALEEYLRGWQIKSYDRMADFVAPSWIASLSDNTNATQMLYWNHNWWALDSWTYSDAILQGDLFTVSVTAYVSKANSEKTPATLQYAAQVVREDGRWYVQEESMTQGITVDMPAQTEPVGVQPVDVPQPQAASSLESEGVEEIYAIYAPYGLTYDASQDALYYEGTLVRHFVDIFSSSGEPWEGGNFQGSLRTWTTLSGTVDVNAIRDAQGELTGLEAVYVEESTKTSFFCNPDGGKYYHATAMCESVSENYLPLTEYPIEALTSMQHVMRMACPVCWH